jgi:hypothetical protein
MPVPAPKMLLYKNRGSSRPQETLQIQLQLSGKSHESRDSHLNPNPRTNKQHQMMDSRF